ncbi:ABC transporter substrate-binding protein [Halioxenophilus sp. WMMB6]|uniref:ABC transporter substrate-binding protein n=1 Tax=Halioxenophilus sp. WMMB6 TaxID=3073815 RepID=UPI00295F38E9|nr:ABC transporter substrate-binding protein [Halioxenophilus sp. WMMB6]
MRKLSTWFFTLTLSALLGNNCFALDKVVFQLDWLPGGDKAPIYAGLQEGFFTAEGLEVTISSGKGSTDALTKLATGRADIGSAGLGALLSAQAQHKIPVTAVASIFNKGPHAFMTVSDSDIKSVADLKGKKVATSPFTSSNIFLPIVLQVNQLKEDDLQLIYSDPGALGPMLATGRTDAIIAWSTDRERYDYQLQQAGKSLRLLAWSDAGMDIYGISLVAGNRFLKQRPEVAKRFVRAYLKALQFVNQQPQKAAQDVHALVPEVSTEVAYTAIVEFNKLSDNEISAQEGVGIFTPARLANTWHSVAQAQKLIPESLDLTTAVTAEFLPTN